MARRLRRSKILDFKVQIGSGRPCDEWESAAGAGRFLRLATEIERLGRRRGQREHPFEPKFERPSRERPTHESEGERNACNGCVAVKAKRPGRMAGAMSAVIEACS